MRTTRPKTVGASSRQPKNGDAPEKSAESKPLIWGAHVLALQQLFEETPRFFHRLTVVAEDVHHEGELSAGLRGVMRSLDDYGPQTVPQLARMRPVSRQHIQRLVTELIEHGYVEAIANPAHKKSQLVRLSTMGRDRLVSMREREAALLQRLQLSVSPERLREATAVLSEVRSFFEGGAWRRAINEDSK